MQSLQEPHGASLECAEVATNKNHSYGRGEPGLRGGGQDLLSSARRASYLPCLQADCAAAEQAIPTERQFSRAAAKVRSQKRYSNQILLSGVYFCNTRLMNKGMHVQALEINLDPKWYELIAHTFFLKKATQHHACNLAGGLVQCVHCHAWK